MNLQSVTTLLLPAMMEVMGKRFVTTALEKHLEEHRFDIVYTAVLRR